MRRIKVKVIFLWNLGLFLGYKYDVSDFRIFVLVIIIFGLIFIGMLSLLFLEGLFFELLIEDGGECEYNLGVIEGDLVLCWWVLVYKYFLKFFFWK